MVLSAMAYCGLDCGACSWRAKTNCLGCQARGGKTFWGECVLAKCCIEKHFAHCGKCEQFPCEQLKAFAFDKDHGDNGLRIENLKAAK